MKAQPLGALVLACLAAFSGQAGEAPVPAVMARLAPHSLLLDVRALGEGRLLAVGERGHVLLSADEGRHWQQSPVPVSATLTAVSFADARRGVAVGHDETILVTQDGGAHWTLVHFAPERQQPLLGVYLDASGQGVAVGAFATVYRTRDAGLSWTVETFDPRPLPGTAAPPKPKSADAMVDDEGISQPHLNAVVGDGHGRLYIAGEAGHLYRSDDGGEHWFVLPSPYAGSFFGLLPLGGDSLLAYGLRGHLYRSDDAGRSWAVIETGTEALLAGGARLADGAVVLAGLAGAVLVSRDEAHSFHLLQQPDRKGLDAVAPVPGGVVAVGDGGARVILLPTRTLGR